MGMLWYTREKIAHASIRVVFTLTAKESDSGVFIRIPDKPTEPWMPINRGYEVEIGDWPDVTFCAARRIANRNGATRGTTSVSDIWRGSMLRNDITDSIGTLGIHA
jgi:hypothetical protein